MKRAQSDVHSKLARFTERCVELSQKAVGSDPKEPLNKGKDGYADWVIVAIHGLREYLDHSYRQLLDVLREMPAIVGKLGLSVKELPDFTTVCSRKQDLKMPVWRMLLELSAELFDTERYKQLIRLASLIARRVTTTQNVSKERLSRLKPLFS